MRDFQVVPGVSEATLPEMMQLDREAPRTAYLLDSDEGGKNLRTRLREANIAEDRIFSIPNAGTRGTVVEDLLDPTVYLRAVNEELSRSHGSGVSVPRSQLPTASRPDAGASWCKRHHIDPPNKRAVAHRVIEQGVEHNVLSKHYYGLLQQLYSDIVAVFNRSAVQVSS